MDNIRKNLLSESISADAGEIIMHTRRESTRSR